MEETVGFVLDQSIAEPTRRRYASAWKKYSDWCSQLGEAPLPITEDKAMAYVVMLTREGLRVGTEASAAQGRASGAGAWDAPSPNKASSEAWPGLK